MGFLRHWVASVVELARDPVARPLIGTVAALLTTGTVFYVIAEDWSPFDALWFAVMTLTTVGYGDLVPQTIAGRAFTIVYVLAGLAVILAFANTVVSRAFARRGMQSALGPSSGTADPG